MEKEARTTTEEGEPGVNGTGNRKFRNPCPKSPTTYPQCVEPWKHLSQSPEHCSMGGPDTLSPAFWVPEPWSSNVRSLWVLDTNRECNIDKTVSRRWKRILSFSARLINITCHYLFKKVAFRFVGRREKELTMAYTLLSQPIIKNRSRARTCRFEYRGIMYQVAQK